MNITIIFTMHLDAGKCNSKELYNIIENINPEIIFEEFDISRTEDEYYKNGHYKYQKKCSVETTAIMNYLENHQVIHVPVDTYELENLPDDMYNKISNNNEEYSNLVKMNFVLSCQYGFPYLNSNECCDLIENFKTIEENVVNKLNDKKLTDTYNSWKLITNNRDNEMIKNIYNFSKNHNYKKAVFITGADHRKSILNKINDYKLKEEIKIDWEVLAHRITGR